VDRDRVEELLPGYEIGQEIGRGGWAVVLAGRHKRLGRKVAIKQLPRAFGDDPNVRARFLAEARLLAALDHPHIVPIYDFVEGDGVCLLVMEELPGGTVWDRFTVDGMTMPSACSIGLATCAALSCAHAKGILHRDVKPENVMFSSAGAVKVTDFGIAKVLGGNDTLATVAGEVVGTPAYMAPEQATGRPLGPATDIYAAGTMLYELLSGALPFLDDGNAVAVIHRHVYEQPRPLSDAAPQVPRPLVEVVMRSLQTQPEDRYGDVEEFGVALAEAATSAWGPGWLAHGDYRVLAAGDMVVVTERPTDRPAAASSGRVGPTRPSQRGHTVGGVPFDVRRVDLVPLHRVATRPVLVPALVSAGLAALAFLVAVAGLGSPSRSGTLTPATIAVARTDPATATPKLDLSKPVPVAAVPESGARDGDSVRIKLSAGGVPIGSGQTTLVRNGGVLQADVNISASRYLVARKATARLEIRRHGSAMGYRRFPVKSSRSPFLTLPALATAALLLFVIGYVESLSRTLRRRRGRVGPTIGLALLGAAFGVAAVGAGWVLVGREPMATTLAACVVIGGGAGVTAAIASARALPRRRRPQAEPPLHRSQPAGRR